VIGTYVGNVNTSRKADFRLVKERKQGQLANELLNMFLLLPLH